MGTVIFNVYFQSTYFAYAIQIQTGISSARRKIRGMSSPVVHKVKTREKSMIFVKSFLNCKSVDKSRQDLLRSLEVSEFQINGWLLSKIIYIYLFGLLIVGRSLLHRRLSSFFYFCFKI